jgi:hypothetical protein
MHRIKGAQGIHPMRKKNEQNTQLICPIDLFNGKVL